MSKSVPPGKFVVLAAIDSIDSENVVRVAARFAAQVSGGELNLVHVIGLPPAGGPSTTAALDEGRQRLENVGRAAVDVYTATIIGHLAVGDPTREILRVAAHLKADLIVVGTHGRKGLDRLVLGSVAEHIVRRASCPVLVVRDKNYELRNEPEAEIEPPCPDCVAVQKASNGAKMWCARHSQPHPHGHAMYEIPEAFALGSSIIRPE
jgi:nucleotide-binding universal stress UspA family protein